MANNFCRFLSNGYRIKTEGTKLVYQPCCWYSKEIDLIDNPNFDQEKQRISEITGWVSECASCKYIEDSGAYGVKSPRMRSFDEIPDELIPDNVPAWMELSIDTTCNAACVMCGPWHSTTWRKQEIKFKIKNRDDLPTLVDPMHWLDVIKEKFTLQYVKRVHFLGGEPFQSPIPLEFLKLLKSTHGSLADVVAHFQTNCSIKPSDELLVLLSECANVRFGLSIDAVGERFEYHRYPLKWQRVQETADYLKNLKIKKIIHCSATLTPLSAWYYDEFEDWVESMFGEQIMKNAKPNISIGNVALAHTPYPLRHEIFKKFGAEHPVSRLLAKLGWQDSRQFVQYMDQLDLYRKTNWRSAFPEAAKFL
jgi:organic radical activating enzyme